MNKVILLGRLTKDPEVLRGSNETTIGKFTLAVPRKYIKNDESPKSDFVNIVTFGKLTEFISKFFIKGQQVLVCGRLEINSYEDENGEKKYNTQIIAEEVNFADSKKNKNSSEDLSSLYDNPVISTNNEGNAVDDLPF